MSMTSEIEKYIRRLDSNAVHSRLRITLVSMETRSGTSIWQVRTDKCVIHLDLFELATTDGHDITQMHK